MLYCSTLPSYEAEEEKGEKGGNDAEVIKADDPKNREKISKILSGE